MTTSVVIDGARTPIGKLLGAFATLSAVDLGAVIGTGPQGAVTIADVEHAAAEATKTPPRAATADRATQMRRSIATAMSRSKREIPH